ncbi:carboxymuconolactone decarboxylase family protein [Caproicibacter sp.]|uniref:carboxymuconolactone decarboxylase family protein n=1 Tax=Caproicibacter sp. TaxID=2814884 RepID=UPI003988BF76
MDQIEDLLEYYRNILHWNPPFAQILSRYAPDGLRGYLGMRDAVQNGALPAATREMLFSILDSIADEESGAKAHAAAAIRAGMTMEELTEAFLIVTIARGINVLCKTGTKALRSAEEEAAKLQSGKENS